jgi:O-acetylhomoserine (thiol)-lyase
MKDSGKVLHIPFMKEDPYGSLSMPVYQVAAYEFPSAEAMELAFTGQTTDFTYSRIANPTVQYFEERVKGLTGALSVTALNSGMAAISNAILTLAYTGSNIVTSRHLFGNTYSFFASTLAPFGVEIRFCDLTNIVETASKIDDKTCALFMEIITNPQLEVADVEALAKVAHDKNVPLIVDSTIIPFTHFDAATPGVDIELVSSTKYISGGATSLGGLILDYGKFDWTKSQKLAELASVQGNNAFTFKLKREIHRNLGAYLNPQAAYLQTLGLETLGLRYNQASSTANEIAHKLSEIRAIQSVNYPGLKSNPFHEISLKQFGENPGAMLTIDLASREACFKFLNNLKLIRRATNLFDNKSLAIHPASTIFGTFSAEARESMHVSECTIRLSIGLENTADLMDDILQALQ